MYSFEVFDSENCIFEKLNSRDSRDSRAKITRFSNPREIDEMKKRDHRGLEICQYSRENAISCGER